MIRPEKLYPPGYEWKREVRGLGALAAMASLYSLIYVFRLGTMVSNLYQYVEGKRFLKEGALAESFGALAAGSWVFFAFPLMDILFLPLQHYFSYWRQTRSIYVMRRLPGRGVVLKSCIQAPALYLAALGAEAALLYGLYLGLYFLVVPGECMPRFL